MLIESVECVHLQLPAKPAGRIALTAKTAPAGGPECVVVKVRTDDGLEGVGFTSVPLGGDAIARLIRGPLSDIISKKNPLEHERLYRLAESRLRAVGFGGLAAYAYAAIDIALWDIKGKAAGQPLFRLLGGSRVAAAVVLGDTAQTGRDASETVAIAKPLIAQGVLGLSVEVGGGDVQQDADRVQQIRDGIGEDAWLGIAVGGRYDLGTALAMAHFYEEDVGVDRYDTPLPAEDENGYRRLAERMEVPLAVGASFDRRDDFRRTLERGDARVLRPNILRLGGITPFLKVAALAEAYPAVVSPVGPPEVAVHLACGLTNVDAVEYAGAQDLLFKTPLAIKSGKLTPPDLPGLGFELNPETLQRHAANGTR